ncbi:MAG: 16S rRNA (guanine(966)-N(2))-methyltransferase RsmD [Clostridia bacterium]|jgi:16S rRNA (guanine966-N2)-methyltransferase|nr:rNA methyltransferase RsmD family [Clostridium sp. CAG:571]HJJ06932.1 16S rRNA (guanine(966)-N(2))-methyltransferase RsmD [Clostridiaceae bacterium]HJJ13558.1 16S rRNA (guanine(966)-N(2))-methyltransferase RsmD [Clostridiaceae bacterium]
MRVISGTARGTKLDTIDSLKTRPTLDRVKESLFNILQKDIDETTTVLDLFAGSGSIGIEFISRGCKKAYLCDKSHDSITIIKKNLQKTRFTESAIVINKDYKACLEKLREEDIKFDIIFLDPPYDANISIDAVKTILCLKLLKENGKIIIETDQKERDLDGLKELNLKVYDCRKYGRVSLIFLS